MSEYIARISYGKDSLKMLDVIVSRGLPLDRITTSDVWATDSIPAELPPVVEFKARMDEVIWQKYRIEVEHLCARNKDGTKKTYEQMFYHIPQRKNKLIEFQGKIKGFPGITGFNWCQKLKLIKDEGVSSRDSVEYIGIAADEPKRFNQLSERLRAPLAEFGIEEGLCGLYCQYGDVLSPTYEIGHRDGCWFCHKQSVEKLRILRRNYPAYWELMLKWDKDSPITFCADGHTVHDFDYRFKCEDDGLIPQDRRFRWDMLNNLQLRFEDWGTIND